MTSPPALARLARAAALLALLAAAAGCRMDEPFDIPLLYEHEPSYDRSDDTIPLLFTTWERKPETDETRAHFLYPFLHYVREGRRKELYFLTIRVYSEAVDHRGFIDKDMILGPVLYGRSADEGSYLTVLPLGGTLRGFLGKDYALGVVPPLFIYTREKDFVSTHVLFPFFNVWSGGGRSGGRFWPFFAHYERADRDGRLAFKRTWILWPFFQTLENNLNSPAGAQKMWFLFPFYGRSDGPDTHSWTVLFPFFKYFENRGSGVLGPLWDLRAPWPFVRIVRARNFNQTDIWPFYGVKRRTVEGVIEDEVREEYYRRFILWPFWRDERQRVGQQLHDHWWIFPFVWSFRTDHLAEGLEKREFKVWPLFRYKRWRDGRVAVNFPSLLWFQDPEGALERIIGPITRVYHEWRDDDGSRRMEILWGLFGDREWRSEAGEDVSRTSILFGLFQYERRDKKKSLRFFFLPTGPDWGEGVEKPPSEPWDGSGYGGAMSPG